MSLYEVVISKRYAGVGALITVRLIACNPV